MLVGIALKRARGHLAVGCQNEAVEVVAQAVARLKLEAARGDEGSANRARLRVAADGEVQFGEWVRWSPRLRRELSERIKALVAPAAASLAADIATSGSEPRRDTVGLKNPVKAKAALIV